MIYGLTPNRISQIVNRWKQPRRDNDHLYIPEATRKFLSVHAEIRGITTLQLAKKIIGALARNPVLLRQVLTEPAKGLRGPIGKTNRPASKSGETIGVPDINSPAIERSGLLEQSR